MIICDGLCTVLINPLMLANNLMVVTADSLPLSIIPDKSKYYCLVHSQTELNKIVLNQTPVMNIISQMECLI